MRQIRQSHDCPRGCFDGEDAWDHWGPGSVPTLDLDKCYPELQRLLHGEKPRPSHALVEGHVTHTPYGWRSFRRVLDPEQVRAIADDLDQILASALDREQIECRFNDGACVAVNLARARDFARRVTDAGFGIHYSIG